MRWPGEIKHAQKSATPKDQNEQAKHSHHVVDHEALPAGRK